MRRPRAERGRLQVGLICAVIVAETTLFAVVTPLLPHFADELDLSHAAAGIVVAANPAASILASLPGGILVARFGARPVVLGALVLAGGASLALGFATTLATVIGARFVQGLAGGIGWAAAFTWLVGVVPGERRGESIGLGMSSAAAGSIVGPAVGALGAVTSLELVFSLMAAVFGALAVAVALQPGAPRAEPEDLGALFAGLRRPGLAAPGALIGFAGLGFGMIAVLAPLRLDHLGAAGSLIGGVFVCAALAEAIIGRVAGRVSDRHGARLPIAIGLTLTTSLCWLLTVPRAAVVVGALVVALLSAITVFLVPGLSELSRIADRVGLQQGLAFALTNILWASGNLIGALGGGSLAGVSEALPGVVVACAAGGLLIAVVRPSVPRVLARGDGRL